MEGIEVFEAAVLECTECESIWPDYAGITEHSADCPQPGCHGHLQPRIPAEDRWWWWSCQPGCLPDDEPSGPFDTEAEAEVDAKED